jgi:hypothetical protein
LSCGSVMTLLVWICSQWGLIAASLMFRSTY